MTIPRSIFRQYSVRGVVGEAFEWADMRRIGMASGTYLLELGCLKTAVGRDGRLSSPAMAQALIEGLSATGMDVLDLGLVPTPVLNFATDDFGADAGIMLTASHNPPDNNGLKFRTDHTLQGDELLQIFEIARLGRFATGTRSGRVEQFEPLDRYTSEVAGRVQLDRPLKVVVDAGNGTNGVLVPPLLEQLGCTILPLYCEVDGNFPHRLADPTVPGALDDLSAQVLEHEADLGVGYDGDGDRLAVVDEQGRVLLGDTILILLARDLLERAPGERIVYELLCSQAVPDTVRAAGGVPIPSPVGYAAVHETLKREEAALGGEMAGHIFFSERGFEFDDAILATAKLLEIAARNSEPFSALLTDIPRYYNSPEIRPFCPDEHKEEVVTRVKRHFEGQPGCSLNTMDGVQILFGGAWALIRESQTQPRLSIRFEARTPEQLAEVGQNVLELVQHHLRAVDAPIPSDAFERYLSQVEAEPNQS